MQNQIKLSRSKINNLKKEILDDILDSVEFGKSKNKRYEFYLNQFGQVESYRLEDEWKIEPIEIHHLFTINLLPLDTFLYEMPELRCVTRKYAMKFLKQYFMSGGSDFDIESGVNRAIEDLRERKIVLMR